MQAVPAKPCGQVPDWVATTIWASLRSVMPWFAANVSASAPSWSWLVFLGGVVLVSLKAPSYTSPENAGKPVASAYWEVIVDQLSSAWPLPSPAKKFSRYVALASWLGSVCQFGPHSSRYTCGVCCTVPPCQATGQAGSVHVAAVFAAALGRWPRAYTIPEIFPTLVWPSWAS